MRSSLCAGLALAAVAGILGASLLLPGSAAFGAAATLTAPAPSLFADFGHAVAVSGDTVLAGAPGTARAYVFRRSGTVWSQEATLVSGSSGDGFGWDVDASGDTGIVGARDANAAYVFTRSGGWISPAPLSGPSQFGFTVAISGDTAVVGSAPNAHIFSRSGAIWSREATLVLSDCVAISGDVALSGPKAYTRSGGAWSGPASLNATGSGGYYGSRVSVSGDIALIGAQGDSRAYLFTLSGGTWSNAVTLTAPAPVVDLVDFGESVAVDGDVALVGDSRSSLNSGAVYVFRRRGIVWSAAETLKAPSPAAGDRFGEDVDLSGDTAVVGAFGYPGGAGSGAAFVFDLGAPVTTLTTAPPSADGDNGWYRTAPRITLTTTEPATPYFQWDATAPASWATYSTTLTAAEGTHALNYFSVDSAGNTETVQSRAFKVDVVPPTDPVPSSSSHTTGVPSSDRTVDITLAGAADATSGVGGFSISWSEGATEVPAAAKNLEGSQTTTTSTALTDGAWWFNLRTSDNAGNWTSTVNLGPFLIDCAPPVTTLTTVPAAPAGDGGIWATAPDIALTANETATIYYQWNGTGGAWTAYSTTLTAAEGTHTLYFRAVDAAANAEIAQQRTFRVDLTAPVGTMNINGGSAYTTRAPVTVDSAYAGADFVKVGAGAGFGSWVPYEGSLPATLSGPDGVNTVTAVYKDLAGNPATSTDTIILDRVAPADPTPASSSHATGVSSNDCRVDITLAGGADAASGVGGFSVSWSEGATEVPAAAKNLEGSQTTTTSPALTDGAWWFNLRTRDNAGNWTSTVHLGPFFIDCAPPVTTLTTVPAAPAGNNGWYKTVPSISLARDEVGTTRYQWDATLPDGWTTYAAPFEASQGAHTLHYFSVDSAGNTETACCRDFAVDSIAPQVSVDGVSGGVNYHDPVVPRWHVSDSTPGSGVAALSGLLDGARWTSGAPIAAEGEHTLSVAATDLAGNTGSVTTRFSVQIPPKPVTGFTAAARDSGVSLAWSDPTTDYELTRLLRSTAGYAHSATQIIGQFAIYEGTAAKAQDVGLINGTTYFYTAFVQDAWGNWSVPTTASATPRSSLLSRPKMQPTRPQRGRYFYVSGTLTPAHSTAATVTLCFWRKVGPVWRAYRVKPTARLLAGRTSYLIKLRLPLSGSWRVRAYHPRVGQPAMWSIRTTFRVL